MCKKSQKHTFTGTEKYVYAYIHTMCVFFALSLKDFQFSIVTTTEHKIQINKTKILLILQGFDGGVQTQD